MQGLASHWEMKLLADGGMSNHDVLRVATIMGAEAIGHDADLGSIEVGKLADLVVLNQDPLNDIEATRDIEQVMRGGVLYDGFTLDEVWPIARSRPMPWKLRKTDPEACGAALNLALQLLPPLSVLAAPFIPGVSERLRGMLNLPAREPGPLLPAETLPEGHALGTPEVLCEKIPDEEIEAELEALRG